MHRERHTLWLLLGLPVAFALVVLAASFWGGGGHPSLSALLMYWAVFPTLTGYLSRAFLGFEYFSPILFLGMLEYPLVGFGLVSIAARAKTPGSRLGIAALVGYVSLQLGAHVLLSLQRVNLHLLAHPSHEVSEAAVERLRDSGDISLVPVLQQEFVEELEQEGVVRRNSLLDALTQLGGAKGWHDLLESGRLGVAGDDARHWRFIIANARAMTNPYYASARGGVTSPYLRDADVERLVDAVASRLAGRLAVTPDSEASLTLLILMRERPDLCSQYLTVVPNGLRAKTSQATYEIVGSLAGMKAGKPPGTYNYQELLSRDEIVRIGREHAAVADEWSAWATSDAAACRTR